MINLYICEKCNKSFEEKSKYKRHLDKKIPCSDNNFQKIEKLEECKYCSKKFKASELQSHLNDNNNVCHYKQKETLAISLIDAKLDKLMPVLLNTNDKSVIINNNSKIINNNSKIVNKNGKELKKIEFRKPGKERVDHITKEMILQIFQKKFSSVCVDLMTLIYFNPDVPENSMWSIAYPKNEEAAIVLNQDTDEFERKLTEDIVEDKFENMIELLFPLVRSIQDDVVLYPTLSDMQKGNLVRFLSHLKYRIATDSPFIYKIIHKLCYEQRRIPMKLWGECGYSGRHLSLKFN